MRILIDECIDQRLRNYFPEHDCQTARHAGFGGLKNGELLKAAETAKFDVLITVDRGMEFQQDLNRRNIAVIIFCTKSNRLKELLSHLPDCLLHLDSIQPGQIVRVGA
jgi:predicted nuclease of predicted toxin-antitoxin system